MIIHHLVQQKLMMTIVLLLVSEAAGAGIVNKPPGDSYTQPAGWKAPDYMNYMIIHHLVQPAKADNDSSALASDEHLGRSWVNISDAGIINKPTDDAGLNKPFGDGNKPTDTFAAWNTSLEKETGAGGRAGGITHVKNLVAVGTGLVITAEVLATYVERLNILLGNVVWTVTAEGLAVIVVEIYSTT